MKQTKIETASARRLLHCIKLEVLVDRNPLPTFPNLAGSYERRCSARRLAYSPLTADRVIE